MNKKVTLYLLSIAGLILVFLFYFMNDKSVKTSSINKPQVLEKKVYNNELQHEVNPLEDVTDEIEEFNLQITKDLSFADTSSKIRAVGALLSKQRNDFSGVVKVINDYFQDIEKHQIEVFELILFCKKAKEHYLLGA